MHAGRYWPAASGDNVEQYVQRQAQNEQRSPGIVGLDERAEGLKLGRAGDVAGEIVRDIGRLGLIGEETNKLLAYQGIHLRGALANPVQFRVDVFSRQSPLLAPQNHQRFLPILNGSQS